jgi:hypothetical protein
MSINITEIIITGLSMNFLNGLISSVNISYTASLGGGGIVTGNETWQLSSAEQNAAVSTNFVTALLNKLEALTALTVVTT